MSNGAVAKSAGVLSHAIDSIASFIVSVADFERSDRLWPAHSTIFDTNPLSIAYGAAGTALFLQHSQSSVSPEVLAWIDGHDLPEDAYAPGLYLGLSGIAVACDALGLSAKAEDAMAKALRSPLCLANPGMAYGAAGIGWALLARHAACGDDALLSAAATVGDYLARTAERDANHAYWRDERGRVGSGFGQGASGIAVFLSLLAVASKRDDFIELARAAVSYDVSKTLLALGDLDWVGLGAKGASPYFFRGAAGVGSAAIRVASIVNDRASDAACLELASCLETRFARLPGQWDGLAGIGEFFLDMHQHTGDAEYLRIANEIAESILWFGIETPLGLAFPGYSQRHVSADFAMGGAGVGLFLLRCRDGGGRPLIDIGSTSAVQSVEFNRTA